MLEQIIMFGVQAALAFGLAFLVEGTTEYIFGTPFDKFPKVKRFKWLLMYLSAGVGVFVCFHYQLDLVALLQQFAGAEATPSYVGIVFTGIAVGRGANYVHQFMTQYLPQRNKIR